MLNPALAPTLQQLDLFVELHDLVDPNLSREVLSRFVTTHRIEVLAVRERHPSQFECLSDLGELDQWIAVWEWRSGPTPWVMLWANSNPVSESTAKEPEEA